MEYASQIEIDKADLDKVSNVLGIIWNEKGKLVQRNTQLDISEALMYYDKGIEIYPSMHLYGTTKEFCLVGLKIILRSY